MTILGPGDRGEAVLDVQARLGALGLAIEPHEHGVFGQGTEQAIREFQQRRALPVDGIVGEETWEELVEAGYASGDRVLYLRYPSFRGDDVRAIQSGLNILGFDSGREDGVFGERTDRAVRDFQRNVGLPADGIVGSTTVHALRRLRPVGPGPGRAAVREAEALRRLAASLEGARIALDAGHGGDDHGATGPTGLTEAEAAYLLAQGLRAELTRRGANPVILRGRDDGPPLPDRAAGANEMGAEILIALHTNSHADPAAEGCSTYFYGHGGWTSQAGHRLAELVQEELTAGLGLKDGRTHPMALPLLRRTRMPAVHVEPCFISNPREEAMLRDPGFRSGVAEGLANAVERFFGRQGTAPARVQPADAP